ncbi:MAG: hypothetical protein ACRBB6_06230 [Neptuniibacter sp.]
MHFNWQVFLLLLFSPIAPAEEIVEKPIEYKVTPVKGYLYGTVDGETAYKDWRRGSFDQERMVEVQPQELPSNLPEPVVIPYTEPEVSEVPVGKTKQPPLKGEDKVFVQIEEDVKEARCLILGEGCELLIEPEEEKDSVYFDAIEKAKARQAELQSEQNGKAREIIRP